MKVSYPEEVCFYSFNVYHTIISYLSSLWVLQDTVADLGRPAHESEASAVI